MKNEKLEKWNMNRWTISKIEKKNKCFFNINHEFWNNEVFVFWNCQSFIFSFSFLKSPIAFRTRVEKWGMNNEKNKNPRNEKWDQTWINKKMKNELGNSSVLTRETWKSSFLMPFWFLRRQNRISPVPVTSKSSYMVHSLSLRR